MNEPRLIALSGPKKGEVFPLTGKVTIGRDPSNTIHISDVAISRQHCVINDGKLFDLESLNGTFVNGIPVQERILEPGDRIGVGATQFLLLTDEKEAGASMQLFDEPEQLSTLFIRQEVLASDALWKFSSEIHRLRRSSDLQSRLLELTLQSIPAERAAIVFAEGSVEENSPVFTRERNEHHSPNIRISRTIANLVLSKGESVLSNDASKQFKNAESILETGIGSILCAPIHIQQKVKGFVYLEASGKNAFSERDLRLLASMASIASIAFENLQHVEWLVEENRTLRGREGASYGILGESAKIQNVMRFIDKAAASDSTVVILGESGTGKELVARALHERSDRSGKPFVAINCAALTEPLLESELFGHERGAFTGAIAQKKGKFELADGGTVFLDEVTELTPPLQAKLLRVLQERTFERVGGTHPIRVNIRILAATNRNLTEAVKSGAFREDLYYRLHVLSVNLPPLRERAGDIPLLATHFAAHFGMKFQKRIIGISPEARTKLTNYHWPGNVRELENAIERAVVLGSGDHILPEDLPESLLEVSGTEDLSKFHEGVVALKKKLILNAMENAGGNFTHAAKLLGLHPNYLHRLIRNLDLRDLIQKS